MEYVSPHTEDEWNALILERSAEVEQEEQMWTRQGFHYGMVDINTYLLQFKLNVLITFIMEELGVSENEFQARFLKEVQEQLKRDRGMLIEMKQKAERPDLKVVHQPKLLGPDGRILL